MRIDLVSRISTAFEKAVKRILSVPKEQIVISDRLLQGRRFESEIYRAKVPGKWILYTASIEHVFAFYPDPHHQWDGNSLP